ncbi:nucleolar protein 12 [Prorops nasuta]|uniref:nucleolar protein 12 n=1 Tax=Prorops nasuta TaxID=863751 RepID=UPI0034CEED69
MANKRKKKGILIFDENKRRDFLCGFHKRKLERRKKAQEELQQQLKLERKRIKQTAREQHLKLLSNRDVPELETLLTEKQYETEGHTVSILELNVADLAEGNIFIGDNTGNNEEHEEMQKDDNDNKVKENDELAGMSLKEKIKDKVKKDINVTPQLSSKKDLKRSIKKAALKQVQKSKAFKQKQQLERHKNKKESKKRAWKQQKGGKGKKEKSKNKH